MPYLRSFVFACTQWCPTHIVLCFFFCFSSSSVPYVANFSVLCYVFLRLLYPMLPISLCCVMFFFVFCTICCQFLCVVLCFSSSSVPYVANFSVLCYVFLRLLYHMLPVSLCFSSSSVPYVASFSGLSICDCPIGIL